jgi:uncharacterized protein YegJ (DUF2314 family)
VRLILPILILGFSPAVLADPTEDHTVLIKTEDVEMNAAIHAAQVTLDDFLSLSTHPPAGASGFKLKVRIKDHDSVEYMWVTPFRQTENGFVGTLADDPEYVKNVRNGEEITFARSQIADWGYALDGKQKGSFTVCVLFKHMPAAEAQRYRDDYGFEC